MNTLDIAWRNLWRNKRRSLLALAAVAAACALLVFMLSMQQGSYAGMIENVVGAHVGHFQVQHRDFLDDPALVNAVADPDEVLRLVETAPTVCGAAPRISAPVLASRGAQTHGAMLIGVDPARERRFSRLAAAVAAGAWLADDDRSGAVLGRALARNLEAAPGDEVVFVGQGADGATAAARLTVRGIVDMGFDEIDRHALIVPLAAAQTSHALDNAVSAIAVRLEGDRCRPAAAARLRRALARRPDLAVREWPEILPGIQQSLELDWRSGLILYAALVLVVALGVANTFLMAYLERVREYGVLLALGMSPARLGLMAYLESVLLTAGGLAAGAAAGSAAALWLKWHGWRFPGAGHVVARYGMEPVLRAELTGGAVAWAAGLVFVLTVLMAVYPSVKAARLKPVAAMRKA